MEKKLAVIVDNNEEVTTKNEDRKMCSSACDGAMEMYSSECPDTRRDSDNAPKEKYLKRLECRLFERHILFSQSERKDKKKAISSGVNVQVVVRV